MRSMLFGILVITGCLLGGTAVAGMYKWVDKEGNVHYSQVRPSEQESQKIAPPPPVPDQQPKKREQSSDSATGTRDGETTAQGKTDEETGQQAPFDEEQQAELYKKNCDIATENMSIYKNSHRIRTPEGEVVRLSDEMRAAKIKEAQEAMDKYCQ